MQKIDAKAIEGLTFPTHHAPQSIVKATLGPRPDGWTAADCDAPVASLSHSGNVVTVEAGLQVAYADGGSVQLSEVLAAPQSVDLSAAADGTHHVYADIAEDGTFSGFGHTNIPPETGTSRGGIDPVPPFTGPSLSGWGSASASGSAGTGYEAWRAFDKIVSSGNFWTVSGTTGWLQRDLPENLMLVGYAIRARTGTPSQSPSAFSMLYGASGTPDQTADTRSGVTGWASGELKCFSLDTPVTGNVFRLNVTGTDGGAYIAVEELFLFFSEDFYSTTSIVHYDRDDNSIRRVYIGSIEKSGGVISEVHCYSLGSSVTVPVNNGGLVDKNTTVVENLPYVFSRNANAKAQIFAEGFWGNAGWIYGSDGLGTKASLLEDSLRIYTGAAGLSYRTSASGGDFLSSPVATPSRVRVTVDRGY